MSKGRKRSHRDRYDDLVHMPHSDAASFFFDLKLLLPPGMTAHDVQIARQKIEHRLQRTLRKKDRVVWTAQGFFVMMETSHPARAGAAAERLQQDLCAFIDGDMLGKRRPASLAPPPPRPARPNAHGLNLGQ